MNVDPEPDPVVTTPLIPPLIFFVPDVDEPVDTVVPVVPVVPVEIVETVLYLLISLINLLTASSAAFLAATALDNFA